MSLPMGEEQAPANEGEVITRLVALQVGIMMKTDPTVRGQHPKHHGCVDAEFVVRDDIPAAYRVGIFKEPATYMAKVRFSNGGQKDDSQPDVHGMAVKVLGVSGTPALPGSTRQEQDFVLIDSESFFVPDVQLMLELMTARATAEAAKKPEVMADFGKKHPEIAAALAAARKKIASPLTVRYWSTVPYKLGSAAVKYTAIPAVTNASGDVPASADYLRQALATQLAPGANGARFDLCIIPQMDPDDLVENPMVTWKAEPIPVATIAVAPQAFDTPERMKQAEEMSFDPWHALAEHRPLGGINRARREVYAASLKTRRNAIAV